MYDVIIIGAGPTGSAAAKRLAAGGFKVLMVERFETPRNKSCTGVLIKKTTDLVQMYFKESVPEHVLSAPGYSKGLLYTNDVGQEYPYEQPTLSVWRSSFDRWLTDQAVAAGAEFRDETAAISCEERNNDVIVKLRGKTEYTEKARIVIACDGSSGTIKQKMTNTRHQQIFTYQTFHKGSIELPPNYFYAYLQPDLAEYNAWFIQKDDYLIFGVAGQNMGKMEHYHSAFMHYMKTRHNAGIDAPERNEKWTMPRIVPGCPVDYGKGRVMFAGEAAGFLNPMGEGISAALECGWAAAGAVEQTGNFDMKEVYAAYKNNASELKAYMERQWRLMGATSNKFAHMK